MSKQSKLAEEIDDRKRISKLLMCLVIKKTSFNDSVWIGEGRTFYNPKSVILDLAKYVKALSVQVYDSSSSYVG